MVYACVSKWHQMPLTSFEYYMVVSIASVCSTVSSGPRSDKSILLQWVGNKIHQFHLVGSYYRVETDKAGWSASTC